MFLAPLGFERAPDDLPIALVSSVAGRELEGESVGVSARAAISELQLRIFMAGEGADFDQLTLETMPFREMADSFRSGAIAAASVPDPFGAEFERDGLGRVVARGSLGTALPAGERVLIVGLAAAWPGWSTIASRHGVSSMRRAAQSTTSRRSVPRRRPSCTPRSSTGCSSRPTCSECSTSPSSTA